MAEQRESSTKQRIQESAMRLFRERSFEHVTLGEICAASGVNKHTFYYHFRSKDELLARFYEFPWALDAAEAADILTASDYVEQLWLIMQKFTAYIEQSGVDIVRHVLIKNLNENVGTFHPNRRMKELCRLQENIIAKGQAAGQFLNSTPPLALVMLLQQIMHSTVLTWVISGGEFQYTDRVRFLFECLLDVDRAYRTMADYEQRAFAKLRDLQDSE